MTTELAAGAAVTRRFIGQEHRDLTAAIAGIAESADVIEPSAAHEVGHRVRVVLDWYGHHLEEHLAWEDAWLSPQLDRMAGTPWVSRLMRFEHGQIRSAFAALEREWQGLPPRPDRAQIIELRGRLYGVAALLRAHVERAEWLLAPLLDRA